MTTPLRQPALFAPAVARPLAPALIAGGRTVTHGELAALVAERRADLPDAQDGRCLVLVELDRSVDSIVGYLATLAAGHAALVVPDACADSVLAQYRPKITCREGRFESTDGLVAARDIRPRHLCTRISPCCSAPPAAPAHPSWCGCHTRICEQTPTQFPACSA